MTLVFPHLPRHGLKEPLVGMMDLKQLVTNPSFIKKIGIYTSV